jgi:hypothetical protein
MVELIVHVPRPVAFVVLFLSLALSLVEIFVLVVHGVQASVLEQVRLACLGMSPGLSLRDG